MGGDHKSSSPDVHSPSSDALNFGYNNDWDTAPASLSQPQAKHSSLAQRGKKIGMAVAQSLQSLDQSPHAGNFQWQPMGMDQPQLMELDYNAGLNQNPLQNQPRNYSPFFGYQGY